MDANTLGTIIGGAIVALLGGGAAGRYLLPRQGNPQPVEGTNPRIVNTGQVPAFDVVTESECREVRREVVLSVSKSTDEIKKVVERQTDTINGLTQAVTKLSGKVEAMPLEIENAGLKTIRSHENKFHSPATTGGLKSVDEG